MRNKESTLPGLNIASVLVLVELEVISYQLVYEQVLLTIGRYHTEGLRAMETGLQSVGQGLVWRSVLL